MDKDDLTLDDAGPKVTEGELVEENPKQESGEASVLMNLESMIKTNMSAINRLQEEVKKYKEMLDDIFASDSTYQEHTKLADEASKVKRATKQQILKRPQAAELDTKVKSLKSEIKENQASLSDYLREFQRMSGLNEIENEQGEVMEIVYTAKLVKAGSRSAR